MWFRIPGRTIFTLVALMLFSSASLPVPLTLGEKIFRQAADDVFNATSWAADSLWFKLEISTLGAPRFSDSVAQRHSVLQALNLIRQMDALEAEIERLYADPAYAADPLSASAGQRARLAELKRQYDAIAPFAEATLESQVSEILSALGLTLGGQPLPWVLYHVSPLPQNLVVSRRDVIQQETNLMLNPDLTTEQAQEIESRADTAFDVSSLVVPIGGVALYPTMVYRSDDLHWLVDTIAHEWTHVYMGIYPISTNYSDPQVRTMNETTAEIAGREIGKIVMRLYYPELMRRPDFGRQLAAAQGERFLAESFDFNAEMHTTRITADALLAAGKIDEAEAYMETRRKFFWDNGYPIRKLNQAYFAFYGAYADTPGGAAGEDPVGPAVRAWRARSPNLKEFLDSIRKMGSFAELQAALEKQP